jgi:hypothetical protein
MKRSENLHGVRRGFREEKEKRRAERRSYRDCTCREIRADGS